MTHPVPASAHPGVRHEFGFRVRRHHTAASLAAVGGEWVPDFSEYNGPVDMGAVKNAGAAGVILRAGFGTVRADLRFAENRAKADAAGLPWMAYWFNYPAYNRAVDEAAMCNSIVGPLPPGRGLASDCENDPGALAWPPGGAARDWAATYLSAVGPSDYPPPWYCSTSFVGPHALGPLATTWPWWVAEYGVAAPDELGLAPVMWQETDRASVAGVSGPCDVSIMLRGSFASLLYGGDPMGLVGLDPQDPIVKQLRADAHGAATYGMAGAWLDPDGNKPVGAPSWIADRLAAHDAQLAALLSAEGLEQEAIDALSSNAASASALAALAAAQAAVKTELDGVAAAQAGGTPADLSALQAAVAGVDAHVHVLGGHLGVDVTTGHDT